MSTGLQAQVDRATRKVLPYILRNMDIPPDSEVGKFVLSDFWPQWNIGTEMAEVYNEEAIFDFLIEFQESA